MPAGSQCWPPLTTNSGVSSSSSGKSGPASSRSTRRPSSSESLDATTPPLEPEPTTTTSKCSSPIFGSGPGQGIADDAPGPGARGLPLPPDRLARDPDAADPLRSAHRLLVGRVVDVQGRVEEHEIGTLAYRDPAAVGEPEPVGRPGGEPRDGLLHRHEP